MKKTGKSRELEIRDHRLFMKEGREAKERSDREYRAANERSDRHVSHMITKVLGMILLMVVIVCIGVSLNSRTEATAIFECSSGDIDTNISAHFNTQEYPCNISTGQPGICFKQDNLMEGFEFKGIDGLTCKGKAEVKAPSWMMMFGGFN